MSALPLTRGIIHTVSTNCQENYSRYNNIRCETYVKYARITVRRPRLPPSLRLGVGRVRDERVIAMADYYAELGVGRDADEKEVRSAFRRLARQYHPDLNPGDDKAEERFKRVNEAYEVLSDEEKRKAYDKYGDNWRRADEIESQFGGGRTYRTSGTAGFGGFEDLLDDYRFGNFEGFAGARTSAAKLETDVEVTLEEAFSGSQRIVTMSRGGQDRRIEVTIPRGVATGSVVRVRPGQGRELLLNITVTPHPRFTRRGADLYVDVDVPLEDAILGGSVDVSTMERPVELKVPPESRNGQRIRLAGKGMPLLGSPKTRGDLYVVLRPVMPSGLTDEQKDLVKRLSELGTPTA